MGPIVLRDWCFYDLILDPTNYANELNCQELWIYDAWLFENIMKHEGLGIQGLCCLFVRKLQVTGMLISFDLEKAIDELISILQ